MKRLALIAFLLFFHAAANADVPMLSTPYQILGKTLMMPEGSLSEDDIYGDEALIVDFGARKPDENAIPAIMTVVGTKGTGLIHFLRLEKKCAFLCAGNNEECHYEGLYARDDSRDIGEAVTAFAGKIGIGNFTYMWEDRKAVDALYVLPKKLPSKELPVWHSALESSALTVDRWDNIAQQMDLTLKDLHERKIEGQDCIGLQFTGDFGSVSCGTVALLLHKMKPVLMSEADYIESMTRPLISFTVEKQTYYLVRLGLKAESAVGLLYKTGGEWRFKIRPKNYGSIC